MARKDAVWGIDIGLCAMKALRCTLGADGETVVADKYDYIEYPKILSSADADPETSIQEAIQEFLSRNTLLGDKVAISVSGQAGLSRFFKPPPVDARTLPDIVKYEVKQQIPFPIEDVIWDWQQLGGTIVDGRTVDAEVGLFAMKRDAVYRALKPFDDAGVEVDFVQLSPLAIFNVVCKDVIKTLPDPDSFDPENPPESLVIMSMGTDTTDLIVTNGIKLWLRSIPIGGNHFTKQLSRELKTTQAKAEHLKRTARTQENPKAIFKAMRQVFNDLVNEVQRSLTFFQSMEKTATISKLVLLGNAAKLPGLRQFLNKQLEIDIAKVTEFETLDGSDVTSQKAFSENVLSFAPCYGLCLQGLGEGAIRTNLLPEEIVNERIIRAKKPWVLASVGVMMLGCLLGLYFKGNAWWTVQNDFKADNVSWSQAINKVKSESSLSGRFKETDAELKTKLDRLNLLGKELYSASEDKTTWLEIKSAIFSALPKDDSIRQSRTADPLKNPYSQREELFIDHIETQYFQDLNTWREKTKVNYDAMWEANDITEFISEITLDKKKQEKTSPEGDLLKDKAGWVIEIQGHHYHNTPQQVVDRDAGRSFLVRTFLKKLVEDSVTFPGAEDAIVGGGEFKFTDFGIYYPTIVASGFQNGYTISLANASSTSDDSDDADDGDESTTEREEDTGETVIQSAKGTTIQLRRYDFVIQMAWIPRSPGERVEMRDERMKKEAEEAQKAAAGRR